MLNKESTWKEKVKNSLVVIKSQSQSDGPLLHRLWQVVGLGANHLQGDFLFVVLLLLIFWGNRLLGCSSLFLQDPALP